jgi:hypothetical protein
MGGERHDQGTFDDPHEILRPARTSISRLTAHLRYRIPAAAVLVTLSTARHPPPWRFFQAHTVGFDSWAVRRASRRAFAQLFAADP